MATLIIKGRMPGLNDYTKACRTNRYAGAKMKNLAEQKIAYYIRTQIPDVHLGCAARLKFKWYEPNKKRDIDNICFAKKFILDALVTNNVLIADSWRGVVGFTDEFYVDALDPRIEVEISEA